MDKQNPFVTFIGQRTHSLIDRITKADQQLSDEHVRRVRVGLKRWRTLYQVITALEPHHVESGKVERSVRRLFKRAGALRDCQLNRQLLSGLSLPDRLEKKIQHFLKKREKKARKRLKKAIRSVRFNRIRKISRRIRQLTPAIAPARICQQLGHLLDREAGAIEALPLLDASPEQLHSVRKHLKSLIEIGNVMRSITPDQSLTRLIQRAKNAQRRLGDWHDRVSLVGQINDYVAHHRSVLSPEKIRLLFDRLDAITQRQTKRIRHEVDKLSQLLLLLSPWRTIALCVQ